MSRPIELHISSKAESNLDSDPKPFRFDISVVFAVVISVGVVLGDITVSSWATLQCRSGRHCGVVLGDIAIELCTALLTDLSSHFSL
jgi:hypothetical protein